MKQALPIVLCMILLAAGVAAAEELTLDRQAEIIRNYMFAAGQHYRGPALSEGADEHGDECEGGRCKCGTPAILDFVRNYGQLDKGLLLQSGAQLADRPQLTYSYDSPGGWVKLHYEKTGLAAIWQANVDSDGDGVPNYIETLALSCDSIMNHLVNDLGYPRPMADTLAPGGGDIRIDVYFLSLPGNLYGQTWGWGGEGDQSVTAWVELDHDFQGLPDYANRPLDAARVTLAHELFHTIHFTIDVDEDPSWREMSSVWMEEHIYDDINDYYYYGPYFFNFPRRSLQSTVNAHDYASVLFPLFLTQKYGDYIVHDIWERCGTDGRGYSFLLATHQTLQAIDSAHGGPVDFNDVMAEWGIWNFFTGPYADQAPNGIGYEEAANYQYFPLGAMDVWHEYPVIVGQSTNSHAPQFNGVEYIRLENFDAINTHRKEAWYISADTFSGSWSISGIYQLRNNPDSHFVRTVVRPATIDTVIDGTTVKRRGLSGYVDWYVGDSSGEAGAIDLSRYNSLTLVVIPSTIASRYFTSDPAGVAGMGYSLRDTSYLDESLVNVPAGVLSPYPNPAVVSKMNGVGLKFKFQMPTDSTTYPVNSSALLSVDLYTVAGERVRTLTGLFVGEDRTGIHRYGIYEAEWDMKNEGGEDVASGAYLAYARLYEGEYRRQLLAEDRVKVAVIR